MARGVDGEGLDVTVYRPKDCKRWRYSFEFKKTRYTGSTGCSIEKDAIAWERAYKLRLERQAAGLELRGPEETPSITDWAAVYYTHAAQEVTRPERIEDLLRVVLRFWGRRPSGKNLKNPPKEGEPYKDLRLGDPIANPDLIVAFEDWMRAKGWAGQTKNQYRSVMNQMYKLAHQPQHRKKTGVTAQTNPFDKIARSRTETRDVTIDPDDLRRLLSHASYHLRLAVAIGALAPKLRLANILALRWSRNIDRELKYITVQHHKTRRHTERPLVVPIVAQLRRILHQARERTRGDIVVSYRGQAVKSLRGALQGAAKAAGLPYGRSIENGLTFHTLRHTAATMLAELDISESKRKAVMGHKHLETTQRYTHLRPVKELAPLEQLSAVLILDDVVMQPGRRAVRRPVRPVTGTHDKGQEIATARDTATRRTGTR